jgi:hypothetical protein
MMVPTMKAALRDGFTGLVSKNVRVGERRTSIALAQQSPDLRAAIVRWLGLESMVTPEEQVRFQAAMRAWSKAMDKRE